MFQILEAYEETSAVVITPGGKIDAFSINTCILQGDTLSPFGLSYAKSVESTYQERDKLQLQPSCCTVRTYVYDSQETLTVHTPGHYVQFVTPYGEKI